jgi:inorganic triphosphatase YgiF
MPAALRGRHKLSMQPIRKALVGRGMPTQREIELKFDVDPDALDAVEGRELLGSRPVDVKRTETVYYDTPKGKLGKAGVTLRVRRNGEGFYQTVKADAGSAAGLFDRAEWEQAIASAEPDLRLIAGTAAEELLSKESARASLRPVFGTFVDRQRWIVEDDGAQVELILDRGEVVAGKRREPICEIELELKRGEERALFAAAAQLGQSLPLRIGVLTKSERGQRLRQKKKRTVVKAEPVALAAEMNSGEAFAAIAFACIRHFRLNEPQVLAARDPDALHQARVALRRLRSAFSIFRPLVAGEQGDAIRAELGWISRVLGEARDLDVFIQKRLGNADPMLADKVHAARGTAYDAALAALDSERFRGAMLNLVAWIATGDWRREHAEAAAQPVTAFAASALDRFWRKVKKGGRGLGTIGDEARHDVRIAGKKLRYAAEFFAALQKGKKQGKKRAAFLEPLEALQRDLGDLNDMVTAVDLSEGLSRRLEVPAEQLGSTGGGQDKNALLKSAEAAHERLVDAGPYWR